MASQRRQRRLFCGLTYRDVQRSNTIRKSQLDRSTQSWLKANGYRNVGWDQVIRLYQKLNDLEASGQDNEPTLGEMFLEVERIGRKYQTPEEIAAFEQAMAAEISAIADLIDQQFPDQEVEAIDFSTSTPTYPSRVGRYRDRR